MHLRGTKKVLGQESLGEELELVLGDALGPVLDNPLALVLGDALGLVLGVQNQQSNGDGSMGSIEGSDHQKESSRDRTTIGSHPGIGPPEGDTHGTELGEELELTDVSRHLD